MSDRLKKVITWTIYIIALLVIIIFALVPFFISIFSPVFNWNINVSGFSIVPTIAGIVLSFLSVGLGVFSIYQAKENNKETSQILTGINIIKDHQEALQKDIKYSGVHLVNVSGLKNDWKQDHNNE